jgi:hypothetical protein
VSAAGEGKNDGPRRGERGLLGGARSPLNLRKGLSARDSARRENEETNGTIQVLDLDRPSRRVNDPHNRRVDADGEVQRRAVDGSVLVCAGVADGGVFFSERRGE